MDDTQILLRSIAAVLVLGTAAQWLAWRIRLPSILLLLALGLLAGPLLQWIQPDEMFGEMLFPMVSLSVAIILFEGSLNLRLRELKDIGGVLARLLSLGVLITWILTAMASYWLLEFTPFKSILLGALLVVTGPTVIGPLLRHIRPIGKVGQIARWEGIIIDPLGAVLAVLVLEAHLASVHAGVSSVWTMALLGLSKTIVLGGGIGAATAWAIGIPLRKHWIPDHLHNPVTLMFVLLAYAGADWLQPESGLLAVTVMGVVMANMKGVILQHIIEFKETLSVLLISSLFILLSARLDPKDFYALGWRGPLFVLVLIGLVRPLAVWASTGGSRLTRAERIFLGWMAPRGIVAAAVASVFALRLGMVPPLEGSPAKEIVHEVTAGPELTAEDGHGLVPATFLVILGTVVVYGLTSFPLAKRLGLAMANPQGVLIGGANDVARRIADALQQAGYPVLLVDTNRWNAQTARMQGLPTAAVNILSEQTLEDLDLGGIGRFFGMTPNDEVNSLAAIHMIPLFGRSETYQLFPSSRSESKPAAADHLRARFLFHPDLTYRSLQEHFDRGAVIKATKLTEEFGYEQFQEQYEHRALPLFLSEKGTLTVITDSDKIAPHPGQTVIALLLKPSSVTGKLSTKNSSSG